MVQVLPYIQSFGEKLIPTLANAGNQVAQEIGRRRARTALQNFDFQGAQSNSTDGSPQQGINMSKLPQLYELAAEAYGPEQAKLLAQGYIENQKLASKENMQERKFQKDQAAKAEPELLERETKLQHYEQEGARFERLQELFSPELEEKFPSSISVGLLTKDGELRPTAAAALSPEAQEAVKLVADNLSGAKDTFGARVTNFDLQAYMKRLPTLLNSADGRRRVLRDLRLINKLNTSHEEGVLDIIEREGGPEKISLSQAERRYRKEHAGEIAQIKKEFISPEKHVFKDRPDPKVYQGRVVVDEETGERFRSNGKEWIPE